jgi:hypothetical protein
VVVLTVLCAASTSHAQNAQNAQNTATRTLFEAPPETPTARALGEALAAHLATTLEGVVGGEVLMRVHDQLPAGSPGRDQLRDATSAPIVEALSQDDRFVLQREVGPLDDTVAALAARRGFEVVVGLRLTAPARRLEARLEVMLVTSPGFAALLAPTTRALASTTLVAPLDASLARLLAQGRVPLEADNVVARSHVLAGRDYLAVLGHDLDGDGAEELLLVRPHRVDVSRLEAHPSQEGHGRLRVIAHAPWPAEPLGALRARRPFATATPTQEGALVRLHDRGAHYLVAFDGQRVTVSTPDDAAPCDGRGHALRDACAVPARGRDYFESNLARRRDHPAPARAPTSFYARRLLQARQPDGTSVRVEAVVTPQGRLVCRVSGETAGVAGHGAALAMSDLDTNGDPELLASTSTPTGQGDRLRLLRVRARDGALFHVWESEPMAGSVHVAGEADLDGDGAAELLAIEEPARPGRRAATLWVVR